MVREGKKNLYRDAAEVSVADFPVAGGRLSVTCEQDR